MEDAPDEGFWAAIGTKDYTNDTKPKKRVKSSNPTKKTRTPKPTPTFAEKDDMPPTIRLTAPKLKKALQHHKVFQFPPDISHALDATCNPYPEEPVLKPQGDGGDKIHFVTKNEKGDTVHDYYFYDHRGGYNKDLNISASKLRDYFKLHDQYGDSGMDILELGMKTKNRPSFCADNEEGTKYEGNVPIIRNTLTNHLNQFSLYRHGIELPHRPHQTYADRRERFFTIQAVAGVKTKKDFSQFVHGIVFEELESWIVNGSSLDQPTWVKSSDKQIHRLVHFIGPSFDKIENPNVRHVLKERQTFPMPATSTDIAEGYTIGAAAGSAFHKHVESLLLGMSPDKAKLDFPCREESDYIHALQIYQYLQQSQFKSIKLEFSLGSYVHKICGCLDVLLELDDGTFQVADHKRTPQWNDEPWFQVGERHEPRRTHLWNHPLGCDLIKYAIQMAVYRKLCIMNGYNMRPTALLFVVHPTLVDMHVIELNLNEKMAYDVKGQLGDIGCGVVGEGEEGKCLSPIEFVELMFMMRVEHLKKYFNVSQ